MAPRGSKKQLAVEQEDYVARKYGGRRSASSGAQIHDQGDVRTEHNLFECKGQFGERTGQKPVRSVLVSQFEKIADEAYAESRIPGVALRFYLPNSPLANPYGFVDLLVRLMDDDQCLEERANVMEVVASGN